MCSDVKSLSNFCLLYSLVGAVFMGWISVMLTYQPFFIGGLDDVDRSRGSAYGATAVFVFTFFLSVAGLFYSASIDSTSTVSSDGTLTPRRRMSGNDYDVIPQSTMPSVLQDYATNLELPPSVQDGVYS